MKESNSNNKENKKEVLAGLLASSGNFYIWKKIVSLVFSFNSQIKDVI